jgi:eukaryotic-like serine/threonine-protein kinase
VLGLAAQACAGLHYAHERTAGGQPLNIVHRDISPQNLVVSFDGVLKLVDFGIAKAERRRTQTESGTIKGKFAYMSPEQCKAEPIDRRTDIFALGTIVWEMLTGQRLFKRGSTYETYQAIVKGGVPAPSTVNNQLDAELDAVVLKALAYDKESRYPTAEAFGEALLGLVHARGGSASASDVAIFFDEHFAIEIEEHADQMREVIAGKLQHAATGTWDIREVGSDSQGRRPSVEFVDSLARDSQAARPPSKPPVPRVRPPTSPTSASGLPSLRPLAAQTSGDFEDNAETQIELDPMSRFDELGTAGAAGGDVATKQVQLPKSGAGAEKRTMLLGTPAPGASERDVDARDTDEQPQSASTLFRPDGAPPPTPAPARARTRATSEPANLSTPGQRAATSPPPTPALAPPTPTPQPVSATHAPRPARQLTATREGEGSASPIAIALAFAISAGVGFGATLLAGHLLG